MGVYTGLPISKANDCEGCRSGAKFARAHAETKRGRGMRGHIYRSGRRRAGSVLLTVGVALALGVAVVLASASSALAKSRAAHAGSSVAAVSHSPAAKLHPVVIARTAGHKIA